MFFYGMFVKIREKATTQKDIEEKLQQEEELEENSTVTDIRGKTLLESNMKRVTT